MTKTIDEGRADLDPQALEAAVNASTRLPNTLSLANIRIVIKAYLDALPKPDFPMTDPRNQDYD